MGIKTEDMYSAIPPKKMTAGVDWMKILDDFDPSEYMDSNVTVLINNRASKGEQIRSFQYAIERLKKNPSVKKVLIHKPGPLETDDTYLTQLADTFYRGLMEVDQWIQDSLETERC